MRRREFVAGGIALAAGAAALPGRAAAELASVRRIERIIDVHCHIFNAADLEGFARKIMVPKTVHTSELHGKTAQKSRIVLMTPAIVDFSKWLEDADHLSIGEQVDVMARIARRKDGPRVHGFVGFDPLRKALYDDRKRKPGDRDPLAIVRNAIEVNQISHSRSITGGFIGVKLYPPMGFRAIGNTGLPDGSFDEPAYLRSADTGLESQIGRKLDVALAQLYT
jgi:hypothetical protein